MKILVIARGFPTKKDPQWGCFEFDQARALQSLGHDVAILSVDRRWIFKVRKIGIKTRKINGITVVESFFTPHVFIPYINHIIRTSYMRWTFNYLKRIWGKPDVIYSHYLANTSSILPTALKNDIPVVGIEHWSKLMKDKIPSNGKYLAKRTYGKDGLILLSVSENLRKSILDKFGVDSTVVPNMIGEEFLHQPISKKFDKFTFISIGSLIHRKGFDILINAAKIIRNTLSSDWQIIIIGEGEKREVLENQIKINNLGDNIKILGKKSKVEICKYLSKSHVFVLPSRSETFGVVYIEAMAMGLPVIATDCGIPNDLVDDTKGIICPVDNSEDIVKAMIEIMKNIDKYDSQLIRDECLKNFSPSVVAKQVEKQLIAAINE